MKDESIQKIVVFALLGVLALAVAGGYALSGGDGARDGGTVTFAARPPDAPRPAAVAGPSGAALPGGSTGPAQGALASGATGLAGATGASGAPRPATRVVRGSLTVPSTAEPAPGAADAAAAATDPTPAPPAPPSQSSAAVADLLAHPERHKGKSVTVPAEFVSCIPYEARETLRGCVGGKAVFRIHGERTDTTVKVSIPRSLKVPSVPAGRQVTVRFRCAQGDLNVGNEAESVTAR